MITIDKVRVNVLANPHTLFLAPSNSTAETINRYVTDILFENHTSLVEVINGFKLPMKIYKDMAVIITENRYSFFTNFTCSQNFSFTFPAHINRYVNYICIMCRYTLSCISLTVSIC